MTESVLIQENNSKTEYLFRVYLENKEVCRIRLEETALKKQGTLEIIDETNLPLELKIGVKEKKTEHLISFLESRILPSNRMFLDKHLKRCGIVEGDWVTMIVLNKGRVYDDEYYIEVEQDGKTRASTLKEDDIVEEKEIVECQDMIGKFDMMEVLD